MSEKQTIIIKHVRNGSKKLAEHLKYPQNVLLKIARAIPVYDNTPLVHTGIHQQGGGERGGKAPLEAKKILRPW